MMEKIKVACNSKEICGTILTDLPKTIAYIYLLNTKLNAYGFKWNALKLIYD